MQGQYRSRRWIGRSPVSPRNVRKRMRIRAARGRTGVRACVRRAGRGPYASTPCVCVCGAACDRSARAHTCKFSPSDDARTTSAAALHTHAWMYMPPSVSWLAGREPGTSYVRTPILDISNTNIMDAYTHMVHG